MHQTFGPLQATLKNTHQQYSGGPIVYQRAVPRDLRDRYSGKTVKHDLKTADIALVAKQVEALNRRYEAEWVGLRAAPESSPQAIKVHAADLFFDSLEDKLQRHAASDQDTYDNATPAEYLTPVKHAALEALQGKQLPTLSDALNLHLSVHPQHQPPFLSVKVDFSKPAF